MSILDRVYDRLSVGKVIKDFGPLDEESRGFSKRKKSVLLVENRGELFLILKESTWLSTAWAHYYPLRLGSAYQLREFINESERITRSLPPSSYNAAHEVNRTALIIALIGSVSIALSRNPFAALFVTAIAVSWFASLYWAFRHYPEVDVKVKFRLVVLASLVLGFGIVYMILI